MAQRLFVSTRKGLFIFEQQAAGWRQTHVSFLGDNVTLALPDARDGSIYAALNLGHFGVKLRRSTDGGATWAECGVPSYAEAAPEAADPDAPAEVKAKAPSLKLIWALESAGPDRPGQLWAGTLPGGLFHSSDCGETWKLNRPLWDRPERLNWFGGGADHPGIHSVCVDPRDSACVTLGVSCGGVWQTKDSGNSWDLIGRGQFAEYMPPDQREKLDIQDPHRLVQCPSQPDWFWIQHHNGVFASEDHAQTFRHVESARPSRFGFGVVVHPNDGQTAWFVPAVKDECRVPVDGKFVVSRTRDGGTTFEILDRGLPAPPAYDLVYRHALDIDSTGNLLAIGSTTGGIWVSEDSGDSWRTLSTQLPPVYAVRFSSG